jgi:hypothetical protein
MVGYIFSAPFARDIKRYLSQDLHMFIRNPKFLDNLAYFLVRCRMCVTTKFCLSLN